MSTKRKRVVPFEKRQKVSTACDGCKRRKFKCSGTNPCDLCTRKNLECEYTQVDRRTLKGERMSRERYEKVTSGGYIAVLPPINGMLNLPPDSSGNLVNIGQLDQAVYPTMHMTSQGGFRYSGESTVNCFIEESNSLRLLLDTDSCDYHISFDENEFFIDLNLPLIQLPSRVHLTPFYESFQHNFNRYWAVFDQDQLNTLPDRVYRPHPQASDLTLMYLICALGSPSFDEGIEYFKSSLKLLVPAINIKFETYLVQCHYMIFFCYRQIGFHSRSYYHLGQALNIAKLLNYHTSKEKFESSIMDSLFTSDTFLSCILGKPTQYTLNDSNDRAQTDLYHKLFSLSKILNQILLHFYSASSKFHLIKFTDLAIELKNWSMNLSDMFSLRSLYQEIEPIYLSSMHLLTVITLCKPLFLYHIISCFDVRYRNNKSLSSMSLPYFIACIKAAIYAIQVVHSNFKYFKNDPILLATLIQSCQVGYLAYNHMNKIKENYGIDTTDIVSLIKLCSDLLPPQLQSTYGGLFSKHPLTHEVKFDPVAFKEFQNNFVGQDIAPAFRKASTTINDSYDMYIMNKV